MKLKNFDDLVQARLSQEEITEIESQAAMEIRVFQMLQLRVRDAIADYMKKNKVGFNEMVKRLNSNPTQFAKIQQCRANLTLASLAHIAVLLGNELTLVFKKK